MSVDAHAAAQKVTFFVRHPRITLALVNLVFLALLLIAGEIVARAWTGYEIGYYTEAKAGRDGLLRYPWGVVPVNSHGYLDEEFDLGNSKKRAGWFGDSVAMGVGAGYPHRISDLVRARRPAVDNWNFSRIGTGFDGERVEEEAQRFKLDYVIYLLNLNDIVPPAPPSSGTNYAVYHLHAFAKNYLDYFRDRSYLYNFARTSIKNMVQRWGFEASGYYAYELWPEKSDAVFKTFADDVNATARRLRDKGIRMCVVISPYEMQISADAARTYSTLGFNWEDGFLAGSAQRKLRQYFDKDLPVYDGLDAFPDKSGKVGQAFVYNAGDKIDWNHPNRTGHAALAKGFIDSASCPSLEGK